MIGTSLNQYRITASIGAGGMGEVFRARDTRLNRDVAVKVLPRDVVADADRLRRFEQEAKTLAALNHPNVLTVFDAGVHEGAPYLVSELLEGKTLREEMSGGALPVRKATEYSLQIAHGLAAAHGTGVIHRDLKPENIFVTKDGRVKILDFGLAKLKDPSPHPSSRGGERENDIAATIRIEADAILNTTEPGMVLGTPAYMSPEQVRGDLADHRADIFAFGCVLYEMLSGTRAFRRNTPVESMNAVLSEEPPDLTTCNARISPSLESVVRHCLEKQPDNRFQSAKDLAFAIENAGATPSTALGTAKDRAASRQFSILRLFPWALAALFAVGFLISFLQRKTSSILTPESRTAAAVLKFELTLPPPVKKSVRIDPLQPAISPDGSKLAYANADGLWLQWLNRVGPPVQLASGDDIGCLFWSPQSADIAYFEGRKLYRVPVKGGPPMLIGTAPEAANSGAGGGAWLAGDRIFFATGFSGLREAAADGGKITTALSPSQDELDFHDASALPDGRGVLFVIHRGVGIDTIAVWTPEGQRKVLFQLPGSRLWKPVFSRTGHVIFHHWDETRGLWAFPFSLTNLERTGKPFRISDADVGSLPSVSDDGTLVFCPRDLEEFGARQLTWVDRSGKILGTLGQPLPGLSDPRLSPDGRRVVASAGDFVEATHLWVFDVASGGAMPFAQTSERESAARWRRDGHSIVFTRGRSGLSKLLAKPVGGPGEEEVLFDGLGGYLSPRGNYVLINNTAARGTSLGYLPASGVDAKNLTLVEAYQRTRDWRLSPDETLLAYVSAELGQSEVYVASFPGFTNAMVVSRAGGGRHPEWHPKGTELFYMSDDGRMLMSAKMKTEAHSFEAPVKVFDLPESIHGGYFWGPSLYDVAPDGERFLMMQKAEDKNTSDEAAKPTVRVVLNWFEEYRDKK